MKDYLNILDLASQGKLPETVDSASSLSVEAVQELVEAGYLKAIDGSSSDGIAYVEPKITLAGREYLNRLRSAVGGKQMEKNKQEQGTLGTSAGTPEMADAWTEIETEYGESKRSFAKKISFVEDDFKRKVIFRDVEQAFVLAHYGFSKPSLVLAGGVIEELLRLYLESKEVAPTRNNLDSYIKACQDNSLLKTAIHRLADSIRQFRNIVHLERESSPKHSISKATAKGAVSSIFTIANDFVT